MNYKKEFGKIYDQHVSPIYRFILLKVNSREKAEDLTAEVFTKGWDKFKKKERIENVRAFLYQIARNLVVDHYREKGRIRTISTDDVLIVDSNPGVDEKAEISSDFAQVTMALSKVKEDYKDVVIMKYLDQLSVPEIAQVMGKSEGSVRVTIHRALNALKSEMEKE
jgi:RNA polymerase sigma-70 factor, ECF subfamily